MSSDPTTSGVSATGEGDTGSGFALTSPVMEDGGSLPADYTCDGDSATPPLEWSGAPEGSVGYAIAMHHIPGPGIPGPGDTHWYWTLWNIPNNVTSLASNEEVPGDIGTNSVNGLAEYAPPCSKGPDEKTYTLPIYALSAEPDLPDPAETNREVLLDAIEGIIIDEATLDVTYTRDAEASQS